MLAGSACCWTGTKAVRGLIKMVDRAGTVLKPFSQFSPTGTILYVRALAAQLSYFLTTYSARPCGSLGRLPCAVCRGFRNR